MAKEREIVSLRTILHSPIGIGILASFMVPFIIILFLRRRGRHW